MPIYEYECTKCGVVEVIQRITEDPLKKCPECRRKVKRLISLNNFHLKGTGWYATDYAGKNGGGDENEKPKKESSKESSTKSTTKSAKKDTETKSKKTESGTTSASSSAS